MKIMMFVGKMCNTSLFMNSMKYLPTSHDYDRMFQILSTSFLEREKTFYFQLKWKFNDIEGGLSVYDEVNGGR